METIKISLSKPIQSLTEFDVNWEKCKEANDELLLVFKNKAAKSISAGDSILFRRMGTIEGYSESDMGVIVEQEVNVISVLSDSAITVTIPKKEILQCKSCSGLSSTKYAIKTDKEHTIFYQDVKMASSKSNPIKALYLVTNGQESAVCATTVCAVTYDLSAITSSYTKYTKSIGGDDCGGNEIVPYDYFFIPIRETRLTFLSRNKIPENDIISFNQNDFYFVDTDGNCIPWTDSGFTDDGIAQTKTGVYKDTGYWNVPIGFTQNTDYVHLYQEERVNTIFTEKVKNGLIPDVINMERAKCAPVIYENDEISLVCGITFNLHFRKRDLSNGWNIIKGEGWNTCNPTDTTDADFEQSDSLYYLGFTDSDVQYQKMKVKKSFIRLSFYSTNDPLTQSLLYYSTIFLDSGYLFGQFNKKRTELVTGGKVWDTTDFPQYVLSEASKNDSDIRIDSQINIHNEFDMTKSSEGFNIYLFADDMLENETKTIYMKVEFNHAGYGKTLPFMVWPSKDNEITIDEYFTNICIPINIKYIDGKYYYYFENSDYIQCNKDDKSITFNLFEPKIKKE